MAESAANFQTEQFERRFVDPDCPFVLSLVAARKALEELHDEGIVHNEAYATRLALLAARAKIVQQTQAAHGCPQMMMAPEEIVEAEKGRTCNLPYGLTEFLVLGTNDQMPGNVTGPNTKGIGFNNGR